MKRYIEIVYDNSGSMRDRVNGKIKFEIAQVLFEKEILPTIGIKGDKVVLRLLRDQCNGDSIGEVLSNNKSEMLKRIKSITHDQSTPLFYTISDAVEACRAEVNFDEYLIFVLTDGDDTCSVKITDVIDKSIIDKFIKFHNVNLLLAQLAVDSDISSNNLTAFTSYIGGRTVCLDANDDISKMRSKIKVALSSSGFSSKRPLEHCYTKISGFDLTWDEVEEKGIEFYEATILKEFDYIDWEPKLDNTLSPLQMEELKFLHGVVFKSNLPLEYSKSILAELKKPYYYSHNCIYWDFSVCKWKYFKSQNSVRQVENPDAKFEDSKDGLFNVEKDEKLQIFNDRDVYLVEGRNTNLPTFKLTNIGKIDYTITLKPGDQIKFKMH